jgi:hypothetical protein
VIEGNDGPQMRVGWTASRSRVGGLWILALLSAFLGAPVAAELGSIDAVPAATLLLPYFEVDLDGGLEGMTTLFSVNNASQAPVVAHVTLWTKLARPTLDFDLYLTGFDVVTVNLRDLFVDGRVPRTGPDFDPGDDTISPRSPGRFSQPDSAPAGCRFPLSIVLPRQLQEYIRALHTGFPAPRGFDNTGLCGAPSQGIGDPSLGLATGYITVDVVNDCSLLFPGNPGYFGDAGTGIAANHNVLWGDYFLVDPGNALAQGDSLVHLEAFNSAANGFWAPGDYTFYGRYVDFDASDNREPLATLWASRYFMKGERAFEDSEVLCWRDTGLDDSAFFPCGTFPFPYPLTQNQVVSFDEQENPIVVNASPFSPPPILNAFTPCGCATNRASARQLRALFDVGWLYLNMNTTFAGDRTPGLAKQAHVTSIHSAAGLYSVGYQAVHLDSAIDKTITITTVHRDVDLSEP